MKFNKPYTCIALATKQAEMLAFLYSLFILESAVILAVI